MGHEIMANAFNGLIIGWPTALTFASGVNTCQVTVTIVALGGPLCAGTTPPIWQYAHCYSQDDVRIDQVTTALLATGTRPLLPHPYLLVMDRRSREQRRKSRICRQVAWQMTAATGHSNPSIWGVGIFGTCRFSVCNLSVTLFTFDSFVGHTLTGFGH